MDALWSKVSFTSTLNFGMYPESTIERPTAVVGPIPCAQRGPWSVGLDEIPPPPLVPVVLASWKFAVT